MIRRFSLKSIAPVMILGFMAVLVWGTSHLVGHAQAPTPAPQWEYHSVGIEFAMLPAKLTELGNDGWEVVHVLHTDQTVDNQQGDDKPHIVARRIEIIAKRPRSR